jgi:hypothetical protein
MRREEGLLNEAGHRPECRVGFWQGYVMGQFYAYVSDPGTAIRCSPMFRTWRLRRDKAPVTERPAARAALAELVDELVRGGWRIVGPATAGYEGAQAEPAAVAVSPVGPKPSAIAAITDEALLGALDRLGRGSGATAAEVGRELLGERASTVRNLPQRVGTKLRSLQLQGKVERREKEGVCRWFVTSRYPFALLGG